MKTIASIEAHMGSSRLPGKMKADICGAPAIERVYQRLQNSAIRGTEFSRGTVRLHKKQAHSLKSKAFKQFQAY